MNYASICLSPFRENDLHLMFSKSFFNYLFTKVLDLELAEHHQDMSEKLCDFSKPQVFIQAHRGSGKSELNVSFVIWLLLTKGSNKAQPYQICLVSATDTQMKKLFQRIKNYVEAVPMLRQYLYPNNIHQAKWNESEIVTKNNVQLIGRPMGSSIRGLHVDIAVLDDVLADELADIEGSKDIFTGVVSPIVRTKKGRLIVVGTPMSYDDLFSDLWDIEKYPGASLGFYPMLKADGSVLWKERFSKDEAENIEKNMGPIKWSREYMLKPIGAGAMLFDEQLVKACVDKDCKFINKQDGTQYYMGCDVALSSAKSADFSCFVVVEKTEGEPLRVVDIWHEHGVPMDEQIKVIGNLHDQYGFSQILVEKVGLSYGMVEQLQSEPKTRAVTIEFVTNQKNKEDILSRLHVLMKNKQLRIPPDDLLLKELYTFGVKKKKDGHQTYETLGKHDDMVMALAMACFVADEFDSHYAFEIV